MKSLRVISADFQQLGEVDLYSSMFATHSWHGIGELELRINRHSAGADLLTKGRLLMVDGRSNKVFIILHREIELNEQGKASENWLIKALSLKSLIARRITLPPSHTAYDNKQGPAETVMKHYIHRNFISPDDPLRVMSRLTIAPDLQRGLTVSWHSRFKNAAEEMAGISLASGLGWGVTLDISNQRFVFDVVVGADLRATQTILPPAIFSPEFETLATLQYTESDLNYRNVAYVAGQGEGVARRVITLGSFTDMDRFELFVDARDIEETEQIESTDASGNPTFETVPRPEADIIASLTDRGQRDLEQAMQEQYLEGQMLTNSRLVYETDYNLGDIVTLQNKDWGVTLDTRITEIKEIYERSGFKIEGTFGNNRPTLIDKIKRQFQQLSGEVTK